MKESFELTKQKGEIIFCEYEEGRDIYFIQSGKVRVTKIVENREKTLDVLSDGDILGEMAILENQPRSATAIAEENTKLIGFNPNNFAQLIKVHSKVGIKLLKTLASRINDQIRKFKIINLPENEDKVMDVFLMYAEKLNINIDEEESSLCKFNLSVSQIAFWAGIPEEDTQKIIDTMVSTGKLKIKDTNIFSVSNLYHFHRNVQSKRKSNSS